MEAFEKFEQLLDVVVCMGALYFLAYSSIFLFFFYLLLPLAFIFDEEDATGAGVCRMLLQLTQKPHHAEGAGDAFLQAGVPPRFERLLNVLLLLAALHFLVQTAIYFSCLFLLLPMSFVISNVVSGANTIMAVTSTENLQMGHRLGQGAAAVRTPQTGFLPNIRKIEDLVVSMAAAYFLVRAGLVFCNLIFILPLVFFLNQADSS